jgi:hypothetical protein
MKFKDQTLGTSAFCFIDMPNMQISEYHSLPGYDTVLASTGPASIIREVLKSELHPNRMIREDGRI